MARAQGARARMALAFETTYGIPPVSGFTMVPFASTTLGGQQPLLAADLLGFGRDPQAPLRDAFSADGDVVVPIDAQMFGFWLKAAFGEPTTTGSGVFTHTFASGGWTLPSLAIETGLPETPRYAMYSGCRIDQLSWEMRRSGLLTATARTIAQDETVATSSAAGSPTTLPLQRFGHFNGAITRDGLALGSIVSAQITYANALERIETIRGDGRIAGADPGMASLSGQLVARFEDMTLFTQAAGGAPCELTFAHVIDADTSFTLTAHAVYLPLPRVEISGPAGIQATFDWQAAMAENPARMCTATLVNAIESY